MAEVAARFGEYSYWLNIQADEPLLDPVDVVAVLDLVRSGRASIGTLMVGLESREDLDDPNTVKVVVDDQDRAINFTRQPIEHPTCVVGHHIGIYSYSRESLEKFHSLESERVEKEERLEQLRALGE